MDLFLAIAFMLTFFGGLFFGAVYAGTKLADKLGGVTEDTKMPPWYQGIIDFATSDFTHAVYRKLKGPF